MQLLLGGGLGGIAYINRHTRPPARMRSTFNGATDGLATGIPARPDAVLRLRPRRAAQKPRPGGWPRRLAATMGQAYNNPPRKGWDFLESKGSGRFGIPVFPGLPPPSFPRKRESSGCLPRLRHYKAVPFGIPAYAGMTVGRFVGYMPLSWAAPGTAAGKGIYRPGGISAKEA